MTSGTPERSFSNRPTAILDAWTSLEVLSPQTFGQPEDLAGGDAVARFDGRPLPWELADKDRPGKRLYYHVVLGAVHMERAARSLLDMFPDHRIERPKAKGYAMLAAITVDREGRPVGGDTVAVSSFGWAFGRVRAGELARLGTWESVELKIVGGLARRLTFRDDAGNVEPLTHERIDAAHRWLARGFEIPEDHLETPYFALRAYQNDRVREPPEPPLLNSFFLRDLSRARVMVEGGIAGKALKRFLGEDLPAVRVDLLRDDRALDQLLSPEHMPAARWPGGGNALVLLQQAAVNVTRTELAGAGMAAVNGPPGTGKTTLLRDVVASVVLDRARALARFDDPEAAFAQAQGSGGLHELHATLKGHEILVASTNNKAVENVSRELPGIAQVSSGAPATRYFRSVADSVAGAEGTCWGLAAAVLGRRENRWAFYQSFWHNRESGFRTYLRAASGSDVTISRTDQRTGETVSVTPRVVLEEKPPSSRAEALARWQQARRRFGESLRVSEEALSVLAAGREAHASLPDLSRAAVAASSRAEAATARAAEAVADYDRLARELAAREDAAGEREGAVADWDARHPGCLARLLRTGRYREWSRRRESLARAAARAQASARHAQVLHDHAAAVARDAEARVRSALTSRESALAAVGAAEGAVRAARRLAGDRFIDEAFWSRGYEARHTSTPWTGPELQRARDALFAAAFDLHRAFIDAAARPIRGNLAAVMGVLLGQQLSGKAAKLLPSLWSTLFLVTPVISTTFASVHRMFGPLLPESIGWLLIDEAGQVSPQAAVGAIARAKRSFVVGDPLQLEPVVELPLALVEEVAAAFEVDPRTWAAPRASAQTRADTASRYIADIAQWGGNVRVGAPLVVHRRCAEPMFSVSNAISYGGAMVQATEDQRSRIGEILGPSRWIDVEGRSEEKWCAEEGDAAIRLLRQLADGGLDRPDLFVITPFRAVAYRMHGLLRREAKLLGRLAQDPEKWLQDRVGTVYTAQGKEAEAVILLLGAPDPRQTGARNWAGRPPNQLNVAVSRAKRALYVIGNRRLWEAAGCFGDLSRRLG